MTILRFALLAAVLAFGACGHTGNDSTWTVSQTAQKLVRTSASGQQLDYFGYQAQNEQGAVFFIRCPSQDVMTIEASGTFANVASACTDANGTMTPDVMIRTVKAHTFTSEELRDAAALAVRKHIRLPVTPESR